MNSGFYKDLDTNFEQACEMSEKVYSHDELICMLGNGNIPQKQIAALRLDYVSSDNEANILIRNLTGCDGKIREAVAMKINQLLLADEKYIEYFSATNFADIFADATIDINANICRLVVDSVSKLIENSEFAEKYKSKILNFIHEAFLKLDSFIFRDKKYVINKQLFKLYWCLEALKSFVDLVDEKELFEILSKSASEREYTIREKAAQIIVTLDSSYDALKEQLKKDENYYVRIVFKS